MIKIKILNKKFFYYIFLFYHYFSLLNTFMRKGKDPYL
jgi:hypothetical protein